MTNCEWQRGMASVPWGAQEEQRVLPKDSWKMLKDAERSSARLVSLCLFCPSALASSLDQICPTWFASFKLTAVTCCSMATPRKLCLCPRIAVSQSGLVANAKLECMSVQTTKNCGMLAPTPLKRTADRETWEHGKAVVSVCKARV